MSREHAYAYEAGYRDGSINYELEHCPACKNVADLQEALAENAKLRDLALNCYRMAKAHCTDKDCRTRCSHWPECCEHDSLQHAEPCELAVLACELGVEVNE